MSKKKGLSHDEKRAKMLEFFHEEMDVFQLKDLEKRLPKEKGITSQSIKDVLQTLVDDGTVVTEKVGTSNYFWSFPSTGMIVLQTKKAELVDTKDKCRKRKAELEAALSVSAAGEDEEKEKEKVLAELAAAQATNAAMKKELQALADNDPSVVREKERAIKRAKSAANRWTDNIFSIKGWCKNKYNMDTSVLDKQFRIPADLDYV
eukprot:m.60036 g.60036  ORF g.60036 m.60036 type:complete len:205 (-) comp13631_c0_seq2:323-937(-)